MFCPFCGNTVNEGANFCASCGGKLDLAKYGVETSPAQSTPASMQNTQGYQHDPVRSDQIHSSTPVQMPAKNGKSCACCGGKVNLLTRMKLLDGNYLCSTCTSIIPGFIKKSAKNWFIDDYYDFKEYRQYSRDVLSPMYNEMASYNGISLDLEHGLFYMNGGFLGGMKPDTLILEMKNVSLFGFDFIPKEYKEGFLNDKVYGKTIFLIIMDKPHFCCLTVLDKEIKTKGRVSGIFRKKLYYELPKKLDLFAANFERAYLRAHPEENTYGIDVYEALVIFGINDLSGATEEDLKAIRSDLIRNIEGAIEEGDAEEQLRRINGAFNCLRMEL